MEYELILSFLGASVLLALTPGPDNIFVLTQSLSGGSRSGLLITLGLSTGLLVHTLLAATGVSLILKQSDLAFSIVKYAGAAYLLYLAWGAVREKIPEHLNEASGNEASENKASASIKKRFGQLYRTGILMNVLNPKVALFFIALFPHFITDGGYRVSVQMVILGFLFILVTLFVFGLVALGAGKLAEYMASRNFWIWMRRIKVLVLAGLAIVLILASK